MFVWREKSKVLEEPWNKTVIVYHVVTSRNRHYMLTYCTQFSVEKKLSKLLFNK